MIGSYFLGIQQIITHEEHFWYSFSSKLPQKPWHHGHSNRKWLKQLQSHFHWPVSIAKPKVTTFCCFYLFSVQQRPPTPDISSSSKNINSLAYLPDYLSVSYEYATGNFNMPILYALEYRYYCHHYGNISQISSFKCCAESNLCCFSLVWTQSSIANGTLCKYISHLESFNCSTS